MIWIFVRRDYGVLQYANAAGRYSSQIATYTTTDGRHTRSRGLAHELKSTMPMQEEGRGAGGIG
jgi:hypothetical protein